MEHWDLGALVTFLGSATQRRTQDLWDAAPGKGLGAAPRLWLASIQVLCTCEHIRGKNQTAVSHVASSE